MIVSNVVWSPPRAPTRLHGHVHCTLCSDRSQIRDLTLRRIDRPEGGLKTQSPQCTHTACSHRMAHARSSLRSQQPSLARFAHALAFAPSAPCSLRLRTLRRSPALPAARFARSPCLLLASLAHLACCSLRSPARSLRSPLLPLLALPLVASPACHCMLAALASLAASPVGSLRSPTHLLLSLRRLLLAPLAASPAARFARRWPLRPPPAARFARGLTYGFCSPAPAFSGGRRR